MIDTREPWEVAHSLCCQVAGGYLVELDIALTEPARAVVYAAAYGAENGGLEQWAREHIERTIRKANALLATHGGRLTTAPHVDPSSLRRLAAMGLFGVANVADTSRTDGDATS